MTVRIVDFLGPGVCMPSIARSVTARTVAGTAPQAIDVLGLEEIRKSLEVFVVDESRLPGKSTYRISHLDDLMAVMANKIQFIDKETLEVARTVTVGEMLSHSHLPEYTARGEFLYVSARHGGDRPAGYHGDGLVICDARTLNEVKAASIEAPAGVF